MSVAVGVCPIVGRPWTLFEYPRDDHDGRGPSNVAPVNEESKHMEDSCNSVSHRIDRHSNVRGTPPPHEAPVLASHQFDDPAYEGAVISARRRSNRYRAGRLVTVYRFVRDTVGIGMATVVRFVVGAALHPRHGDRRTYALRPVCRPPLGTCVPER